MIKHGTLVHFYDHHPRLGRHQVLDARSLDWLHQHDGSVLKPAEHQPRTPVLDQEDLNAQGIRVSQVVAGAEDADALGSCTGNAGTAAVSALLTAEQAKTAGLDYTSAKAAEEWAIGLYAQATGLDSAPGTFPPDDAGSSGLGIAKALKQRKLIRSYTHATTATGLASLLQNGPVLLGVPWFVAWFEPDASGFIDRGDWESSQLAGGHELCVTALEKVATDWRGQVDPDASVIRFRNSWSATWGDHGEGRMSLATYQVLRRYIDAIQLHA